MLAHRPGFLGQPGRGILPLKRITKGARNPRGACISLRPGGQAGQSELDLVPAHSHPLHNGLDNRPALIKGELKPAGREAVRGGGDLFLGKLPDFQEVDLALKPGDLLFELHPRLLDGRVPLPEAVCGQHLLEGVPVVNPRSRQSARIARDFARMSLAGASPPIAQVFAVAASGINSFTSGLGEGSQKSAARCSAAEEPPAWPERISRVVREPVWAAAALLVRPSAGSAGAVRTAPLCRPSRRSH